MRCTRFALSAFLGLVCTVSYVPAQAARPADTLGVRVPKIAQIVSEQDAVLDGNYGPYPYDGYDYDSYDEAYQSLYDDDYPMPPRAAAPAPQAVIEAEAEAPVAPAVREEVQEKTEVTLKVEPQNDTCTEHNNDCEYDCDEYSCDDYDVTDEAEEFDYDDYDYSYDEYGYGYDEYGYDVYEEDVYDADCYDANTCAEVDEDLKKMASEEVVEDAPAPVADDAGLEDEGLEDAPVAPQVGEVETAADVEVAREVYGEGYPSAYINAQLSEGEPTLAKREDHFPADLPSGLEDETCDYCHEGLDRCENSECPLAVEHGRAHDLYDEFGCYDDFIPHDDETLAAPVVEEHAQPVAEAVTITPAQMSLRAASVNAVLRATAQLLEECSDTMLQISRGIASQADTLEATDSGNTDEARLQTPAAWDGYIGL